LRGFKFNDVPHRLKINNMPHKFKFNNPRNRAADQMFKFNNAPQGAAPKSIFKILFRDLAF